MENNTEHQIGLFITGRNPGFEKFVKINWQGEEPGDVDNKTGAFSGFHNQVEPKEPYYAAELGPLFTTYECTLPNFLGSDGRISDFRYYLRIPADYRLTNPDGSGVSPYFVLNELRKAVEGSTLKNASGFWKIDLGGGYVPQWNIDGLKETLSGLRLHHTWGETVKNSPAPAPAGYDTADKAFYALHMKSQAFMPINASYSKIYYGDIPATENIINFGDNEVLPQVRVRCKTAQNTFTDRLLTNTPLVISSKDLGYPVSGYDELKVSLTAQEVLNAYNDNLPLPLPEGVTYKLNENMGDITIEMKPEQRKVVIKFDISGIKEVERNAFMADLTFDGMSVPNPLVLMGTQIEDFITAARQPGFSARFGLKSGSAFILKNALYKDNSLYLTADKPKPKKPTAPTPSSPAHTSGEAALIPVMITLPSSENNRKYPVTVMQKSTDGSDLCIMTEQTFLTAGETRNPAAKLNLPLSVHSTIAVEVGAPALYVVSGISFTSQLPGFDVDLSTKSKRGVFSRFLSTIGFKEEPFMGIGFKLCRWLLVLCVLFWLFISGLIIGGSSETVTDLASRYIWRVERPEPQQTEQIEAPASDPVEEQDAGEKSKEEAHDTENQEDDK